MLDVPFLLILIGICIIIAVAAYAIERAVENPTSRLRQALDAIDIVGKLLISFVLIWSLWDGLRRTLNSNNYLFLATAAAAIFCGYYWARRRPLINNNE